MILTVQVVKLELTRRAAGRSIYPARYSHYCACVITQNIQLEAQTIAHAFGVGGNLKGIKRAPRDKIITCVFARASSNCSRSIKLIHDGLHTGCAGIQKAI